MKRWGPYLLAAVMVFGLCLSGCSKASQTGSEGTKETPTPTVSASASASVPAPEEVKEHTFTFLNNSNPSWPYDKNWPVWTYIKEKTGVTLDVQIPPGEIDEAINLAVASNSMPDMMFTASRKVAADFGAQGALVNILDYLDIMPNFKAWMATHPAETQDVMTPEGKMFLMPNEGTGLSNRMPWMYRKDIFEKNQLQPPATWDELYTVLKKLKEIYPESYPFGFRSGLNKFLSFAPSFQTGGDWAYYDHDKKEWRFGPIEDNYKKIVEYMAKFYKEGLIPPDFLSIETKQWQDLISTGKSFVTIDYIGRIDFFNVPMRQENPDYNLSFMAPPAAWAGGPQLLEFTQAVADGIIVSSTSKQIEAIMKYLDFFYSEEGRTLVSWGKEGETYKVVDGKKQFITKYPTVADYIKATGFQSNGVSLWFDYDAPISLSSPELQFAYAESKKYDSKPQPSTPFTPQELDDLSVVGDAIDSFRVESISKFILGTTSLDNWDKYVSDMNNLGVDKIVNIYKTAHDRVLNASK